ncbi:hypothetical protein [Peribacillus frigoritolerans]|uniref:Uncharacterized protein n=1 Tax=Peribacillus castrilensis TaxID=2897690 RepID=A0AAW9NAV4_9BACI|nr:hypothetical protein [Peribacillus castrilensis]
MKSIYVIKEAILAIASFFVQIGTICPSQGYFISRGIHMTAITHIIFAVPDLDAAIMWYE